MNRHDCCTPDGRCLVPPHPDLNKKMKTDLAKAKKANPAIASFLSFRESRNAPGLNDGLIYPGDYFPLGTSVETVRRAALERAPLSGTVRIIIVLVGFPDKAMVQTKAHFEQLFFSVGSIATGSVKEYFTEVSNAKIDLQGQVVGPFTMPKKITAYANGQSGTGSTNPNARDMALDAANAANSSVNYSIYDNDSNGFVDAFIVIHAGKGGEVTGNTNDIWSHKWNFRNGPLNADGTKVYSYLTVPEDSKIGVCCHELGHLLFGWPDLYDTDGSSEGLGNFCLMAGGSWNGVVAGNTPAHPSAWCKANQGWVSVVSQTANANVSIQDVKSSKTVYRLWKNGAAGSEYFLVENRQKTKFDSQLPAGGLMIYHVDEAISGNSNEAHPKVAMMEADGQQEMKLGLDRGDAGSVYPGNTNNETFNKSSNPNSLSYGNVDTCVGVTNIGASGATMTARLSVKCKVIEKVQKELIKEIEKIPEKPVFDKAPKEFEKPVTDKSAALDKFPDKAGEKIGEKVNEGGIGGGLEQRVAAIENAIRALQPFIGQALRPDVGGSTLQSDPEAEETQARMREGIAEAKRHFDTKPPEGKPRES